MWAVASGVPPPKLCCGLCPVVRVSSPTGGPWLAEWLPAQADALAGCQDMT